MVTMVWVVSRFRLKAPPGISSSCISPLTSLGQRSRASWASQPQKSATLSPQRLGGGGMLTVIGLTPGGSSTVYIYAQTVHRTTQLTTLVGRLSVIGIQSGETKINLGRVRAVPRLCELYPGICLTTEEIARKTLSQGSRRVPVGTMKTEYTEQNICNNKNT